MVVLGLIFCFFLISFVPALSSTHVLASNTLAIHSEFESLKVAHQHALDHITHLSKELTRCHVTLKEPRDDPKADS